MNDFPTASSLFKNHQDHTMTKDEWEPTRGFWNDSGYKRCNGTEETEWRSVCRREDYGWNLNYWWYGNIIRLVGSNAVHNHVHSTVFLRHQSSKGVLESTEGVYHELLSRAVISLVTNMVSRSKRQLEYNRGKPMSNKPSETHPTKIPLVIWSIVYSEP
jgi:hypothetical protein